MENSDVAFIIMSFVAVLAGIAVFYLKDRNKSLTIELLLKESELDQKDMRYEAALVEWVKANKRKNEELAALQILNDNLAGSKVRLSRLVKILRLREDPITFSITWFKTPETDIRVCKARVREQLGIELENAGVIKYQVSENYRGDLKETEIKVTATINTLNLKYDGRTEGTTEQNRAEA